MSNKKPSPRRRREFDDAELSKMLDWLVLQVGYPLGITVHINGPQHPTALVTLDLGQPLEPFRLTTEQVSELHSRMRRIGRDVLGRDGPIRVTADFQRGIHYASVPNASA